MIFFGVCIVVMDYFRVVMVVMLMVMHRVMMAVVVIV